MVVEADPAAELALNLVQAGDQCEGLMAYRALVVHPQLMELAPCVCKAPGQRRRAFGPAELEADVRAIVRAEARALGRARAGHPGSMDPRTRRGGRCRIRLGAPSRRTRACPPWQP